MGVESHATHPIAAHKHQVRTKLSQKAFFSKGWDVPVPGQGRLEFTRRRVPDFDGFVKAAAGNLFAVWTERNANDGGAAQKHQISTNLQKKAFYKGDGTYLCPVNVDWSSPDDAFQILMVMS